MATRFDICAPRKVKNDKTFWHRIGTAWQGDKGIQLVFDSLPIPDAEGRCVANLFEPREQGDAPRQQRGNGGGGNRFTDDGDGVPFLTAESIW